jgi:hypothetical protein
MKRAFNRVKVFGERNSGTHYIANLISLNFRCRQLRGTANLRQESLLSELAGLPSRERMQKREKLTDEAILSRLQQDLGWKHGCVHFDVLEQNSAYAQGTLFVVIHKHPADWLRSFHQRPYNALRPVKNQSFGDFIRQPWEASRKENLPLDRASLLPISIWNEKHRSWLCLRKRGYHVLFLKNSDFLSSFEDAVAPLSELLERKQDSPAGLRNMDRATKGSADSLEDLRRKYVNSAPFEGYSDKDLRFVEKELDSTILHDLNYSLEQR